MLCSISDVYDAMRSQRAYQGAYPTERILAVLQKSDGVHFDQHLVRRFSQLMGLYPPGNMVRLDTGHVGVVIRTFAPDPRRPRVRVIIDAAGHRLTRPFDVNLWEVDSETTGPRTISTPVDPKDFGVDPLTLPVRPRRPMAPFHLRPRPRRPRLARRCAAPRRSPCRRPGPRRSSARSPTLLVLVVVDQMRADYLTRFDRHFTGGFRRLIDQGAIFERTFYPYLNTVTCAGHATLGTGAWPKTHGIILNEWYRRDLGRVRSCTADAATTPVQYVGTPEKEGHSARELLVPTLAERLRARWPQSRSVSVAVKPRSAVMMAGKGATAVTWVGTDGWQTSTAFATAPVPEVVQALGPQPFAEERSEVWTRLHGESGYEHTDAGIGERPPKGWTALFPHPLTSPTAPEEFLELWQTSPYSDHAVGGDRRGSGEALPARAARRGRLPGGQLPRRGQGRPRLRPRQSRAAGHHHAPRRHARHAARRARRRGRPRRLRAGPVGRPRRGARCPRGGARPGSRPDASRWPRRPRPSSRRSSPPGSDRVRTWPASSTPSSTSPTPRARRSRPRPRRRPWPHCARCPACRRPSGHRASTRSTRPTRVFKAIRAGFVPGRSGDFTLVPAPYWIFVPGRNPNGGSATTHGSANAYDQHVPLVFYGAPFTRGRNADAATPADASPTLGATVGLAFDGVEGRPLPAATRR